MNRLTRTEEANSRYKNLDNDERGIWISDNLTVKTYSEKNDYPIITPGGREVYPAEGRCWGVSKDKFQQLTNENRIWFGHDGNNVPRLKRFLSDVQDGMVPISLWKHGEVGHNQEAKQESNKILFEKTLFETPKPVRLIQRILQLSTSKDDIILDSFAGSGTTAHAVIAQNKQDGGNRKFILIETLDYAKEITAERVKRVQQGYAFKGKEKTVLFEKKLTTTQVLNAKGMEKLSTEVKALIETEKENYTKIEKTFKENSLKIVGIKEIESFKEGLGGGFKYCELGSEIFDETGELNPSLTFENIAKHIYFVEFKQPLMRSNMHEPFVGSYKKEHLYFYEERFRMLDLKKLLKEHESYKQLIVYTRKSSISDDELKKHKVIIRYIPYDIKDN